MGRERNNRNNCAIVIHGDESEDDLFFDNAPIPSEEILPGKKLKLS